MPKPSRSSKKDPQVRIAHILDSINAVESYLDGMTLKTFTHDAPLRIKPAQPANLLDYFLVVLVVAVRIATIPLPSLA